VLNVFHGLQLSVAKLRKPIHILLTRSG